MKLSKFQIIYVSSLISIFIIFLGFVVLRINKINLENSKNVNITHSAEQNINYVPLSQRNNSIIHTVTSSNIDCIDNSRNTILFFLASWCPSCIEEIDALKKAQLESENINYIIVSHDKNKEDLENFLIKYDANFFVLWDPNKYIRTKLNKEDTTIPGTYLLDKNKNVIEIQKDIMTYDSIISLIKK